MTGKSAFEVLSLLQGPNETFVTIKVVIVFVPNHFLLYYGMVVVLT